MIMDVALPCPALPCPSRHSFRMATVPVPPVKLPQVPTVFFKRPKRPSSQLPTLSVRPRPFVRSIRTGNRSCGEGRDCLLTLFGSCLPLPCPIFPPHSLSPPLRAPSVDWTVRLPHSHPSDPLRPSFPRSFLHRELQLHLYSLPGQPRPTSPAMPVASSSSPAAAHRRAT